MMTNEFLLSIFITKFKRCYILEEE